MSENASEARVLAKVHDLLMSTIDLSAEVGNACFVEQTDLRGLAGMFIARAAQSVASAGQLSEVGLVADAMSCGRTVVEMAIDFRYIAMDATTRIKMFSEYDHVTRFRLADAVDRHGGSVPIAAMTAMRARHDQARLNNPDSENNWAGCSIKRRARDTGRMALYEMMYAEMCTASHSCYGTLEYALVWDNGVARVRFGRMTPDPHPMRLAIGSMSQLLAEVVEACGLDVAFGERLKTITDEMKTSH